MIGRERHNPARDSQAAAFTTYSPRGYIEETWLPRYVGFLSALHDMPALSITFLLGLLLLWANFVQWGIAAPFEGLADCPGYKASNVMRSVNSITADLTLAGSACDLYSSDITNLKFLAEWQTGMLSAITVRHTLTTGRLSPPHHDQ